MKQRRRRAMPKAGHRETPGSSLLRRNAERLKQARARPIRRLIARAEMAARRGVGVVAKSWHGAAQAAWRA